MAFPIKTPCPKCPSWAHTGRTENVVWIECLVCGYWDWRNIPEE